MKSQFLIATAVAAIGLVTTNHADACALHLPTLKLTGFQISRPHQPALLGATQVEESTAGMPDAVLAHDHNRADLSKWFENLHDRKGDLCCDGSEAMHLSEVDWATNGNHYRVRVPTTPWGFERAMAGATNVETEWVYVPDEALIDEPNRANMTMVWPLYGPMGVSVRCFMPGTMT
ncbi:hypothetical protein Q2941_19135 [Bradyrhizobium sp. UFLA05-153]